MVLTGDRELRKAAKIEALPVGGTIWVVEHLVEQEIINKQYAFSAYRSMQEKGRRLPWDAVYERLGGLR